MKLKKEIADLERSATLTAQWQAEKQTLASAQKVKEALDGPAAARNRPARGRLDRAGEKATARSPT